MLAAKSFQTNTSTPELARLKSGFLIREILNRFTNKIESKLMPDRSIWIYSAHDSTIASVLNSLALFEVTISKFSMINNSQNKLMTLFLFSIVAHPTICFKPSIRVV